MKSWREYFISIFFAILIAFLVRTFLIGVYKVPTGSMQPALKPGDFIFANKLAYGITFPFSEKKILSREPERGDVIVFTYKDQPKTIYVKRVMGIPGDKIEILKDRLVINGIKLDYKLIEDLANNPQPDLFDVWEESSLKTTNHVIFEKTPLSKSFGPLVVPPGEFFVMGDNRDASDDSRYWGTISEEGILGRVSLIWLSLDWRKSLAEERMPRVRWERIFTSVH